MSGKRLPTPNPAGGSIDAALASFSADELREVVRDLLRELDDKAHARALSTLIQRAARGGSGWVPAAVSDSAVAEVLDFATAAARVGQADPSEVDLYLRRGTSAFLRKDYAAALQIFGALLRPIGAAEIDLGQDELVDEVLGVDISECAAQYVASAYMLAAPALRADVVRAAIDEMRSLGQFFEPIREIERAAVEPLPGLAEFLPKWRALIERTRAHDHKNEWDSADDSWQREVIQRIEGSEGLAKIARSTRRAGDLRAWCSSLVEAGDQRAALAAFEEAAALVTDKDHARGYLLDGAALAAQELGRADLSEWLERAWRAAPSVLRLRRWLAAANNKAALLERTAEALAACPKRAARQRALLHVLQGNFEAAAKQLAAAPGLGWSDNEHPGHLLFPMFAGFLGVKCEKTSRSSELFALDGMDLDELDSLIDAGDEKRLATADVASILCTAGVDAIPNAAARDAVLSAMREAAEKRLAGVTDQKRRRHYGHAAELVAVCVACDPSPQTARWVAALRTEHRRFPALRGEFDRALASS